jgi:DNA polymerase III subunit gamma/tau
MQQQVIYLRYRPEVFDELIGQDHVVIPLKNAIDTNRIAHAYLFSGPRGCGKTTSARILARCLNCEKGPTSKPCGKCQSCKDLGRGGTGSLDVIEMDAASHGHVDDARDLEQKLSFATVRDRFRIVILDEAHMITKEGFNALLKSIEEPPPHVKFIFATTEPEKVISTIRSRTYHYPFKLVPNDVMKKYIADICKKEKVQISDSTLDIVIKAGDGSVRDTESVLDQLISGANKNGKIDEKIAISLLGFTPTQLLEQIISACFENKMSEIFELLKKVFEQGQNERRFLEDLLEQLQKHISEAVNNNSKYEFNKLAIFSSIINSALYESVQNLAPQLHLNVVFSKILLKLHPAISTPLRNEATSTTLEKPTTEKQSPLSQPTSTTAPLEKAAPSQELSQESATEKGVPSQELSQEPSLVKQTLKDAPPQWQRIIDELKTVRMLTSTFLAQNAIFEKIDNENIYISFNSKETLDGFLSGEHDKTLLKVASNVFSKDLKKVNSSVFIAENDNQKLNKNEDEKVSASETKEKKISTETEIEAIKSAAEFAAKELGLK